MTPFRKTQVKAVLQGMVRSLCAFAAVDDVRDLVESLAHDRPFWGQARVELEPLPKPSRPATLPEAPQIRVQRWEHRCDADDQLVSLGPREQCGCCGARDPLEAAR